MDLGTISDQAKIKAPNSPGPILILMGETDYGLTFEFDYVSNTALLGFLGVSSGVLTAFSQDWAYMVMFGLGCLLLTGLAVWISRQRTKLRIDRANKQIILVDAMGRQVLPYDSVSELKVAEPYAPSEGWKDRFYVEIKFTIGQKYLLSTKTGGMIKSQAEELLGEVKVALGQMAPEALAWVPKKF